MPLARLQLKLNAVVLPVVLVAVAILVWADYRHEFSSTMEAGESELLRGDNSPF